MSDQFDIFLCIFEHFLIEKVIYLVIMQLYIVLNYVFKKFVILVYLIYIEGLFRTQVFYHDYANFLVQVSQVVENIGHPFICLNDF